MVKTVGRLGVVSNRPRHWSEGVMREIFPRAACWHSRYPCIPATLRGGRMLEFADAGGLTMCRKRKCIVHGPVSACMVLFILLGVAHVHENVSEWYVEVCQIVSSCGSPRYAVCMYYVRKGPRVTTHTSTSFESSLGKQMPTAPPVRQSRQKLTSNRQL